MRPVLLSKKTSSPELCALRPKRGVGGAEEIVLLGQSRGPLQPPSKPNNSRLRNQNLAVLASLQSPHSLASGLAGSTFPSFHKEGK